MDKATRKELNELRATRDKIAKALEEVTAERYALDRRIAGLKQVVASINRVLESEDEEFRLEPTPVPPEYEGLPKLGLTEAVRKIVQNAGMPVGATEIRNRLLLYHYKKLPQQNPVAAIHGVLTRLLKAGEVAVIAVENKKLYSWVDVASRNIEAMYGLGPGFDPRNLGSGESGSARGSFARAFARLGDERMAGRLNKDKFAGRYNKGVSRFGPKFEPKF